MDLQALDAAFFQTSTRPQRDESPTDTGRQFTAELNQAMSQRRQEAGPRPERPRAEDRPADNADRQVRNGDSPEPRPRRQTEAADRPRGEQDASSSVDAEDGTGNSVSSGETQTPEETVDVEVAGQDQPGTDQPTAEAAPAGDVAETEATPPAVVVPTAATPVEVPPAAIVPVVAAAGAALVDPVEAPSSQVPVLPDPDLATATPAQPTTGLPIPAEMAMEAVDPGEAQPPSPPVQTANSDAPATPVQAPTSATAGIAAVPAAATNVASAAEPTASAAAQTAAATQQAATAAQISATQAPPATDAAVTVTAAVAAEAPTAKPTVSSLLTLQSMDEAPVANAPAPTATVTTTAVQPTAQGTNIQAQTQTPDQIVVAAQPTAAGPVPAFAEAVDEAAAVEGAAEASAAETAEVQASNTTHGPAERRASVEQTLRAESAQPARQNLPPQPVADQIAGRIAKLTQAGDGKISMQLRPEALGHVDVDIEVRKDGTMRAVISVEKPETLEWLKRDAQHLERALQDVGVKTDSGSLNFALREQRQDGSGGFSRSGPHRGPGLEGGAEPNESRMAEARMADAAARRIARGGVDVRI